MWSIRGSWQGIEAPARDERALHRLEEITRYWEQLRNDRLVPSRAEVNPNGLQMALGQTFILERMAPGMARIRVSGRYVNDLLGVELRGMPLSALIDAGSREAFREVLEDVFRGPARATLRFTGDRGRARPALEADMILLPLSGHRGDVSRVLGGLAIHGQIGSHPRRLTLDSSFSRKLKQSETTASVRTKPTRIPYLRVVDG